MFKGVSRILTFSEFLNTVIQENKWIYTHELLEKIKVPLPSQNQLKSFEVANSFYKEFLHVVYAVDILSMLNSLKIWAANNNLEMFALLTTDMIPILWLGEGYYGIIAKYKEKMIIPCALYQHFEDLYINFPMSDFVPFDICDAYRKLMENEENVAMNIVYARSIDELKREFKKNFKEFEIVFKGPDYYDLYLSPIGKKYVVAPLKEILKDFFQNQIIYFSQLLSVQENLNKK